jgi:hypothetical protein
MSQAGNDAGPASGKRDVATYMDDEERAFTHQITLFSVAAAMVGVCLTAISLIMVAKNLSEFSTICDGLLVLDALTFLASTLLSFLATETRYPGRGRALHRAAILTMLAGLALMALVCVFLVFTLV